MLRRAATERFIARLARMYRDHLRFLPVDIFIAHISCHDTSTHLVADTEFISKCAPRNGRLIFYALDYLVVTTGHQVHPP